jgi:hypothetical protein
MSITSFKIYKNISEVHPVFKFRYLVGTTYDLVGLFIVALPCDGLDFLYFVLIVIFDFPFC